MHFRQGCPEKKKKLIDKNQSVAGQNSILTIAVCYGDIYILQ